MFTAPQSQHRKPRPLSRGEARGAAATARRGAAPRPSLPCPPRSLRAAGGSSAGAAEAGREQAELPRAPSGIGMVPGGSEEGAQVLGGGSSACRGRCRRAPPAVASGWVAVAGLPEPLGGASAAGSAPRLWKRVWGRGGRLLRASSAAGVRLGAP